jgi:hypothetical protein
MQTSKPKVRIAVTLEQEGHSQTITDTEVPLEHFAAFCQGVVAEAYKRGKKPTPLARE